MSLWWVSRRGENALAFSYTAFKVEVAKSDKHSSLRQWLINYDYKMFNDTDPVQDFTLRLCFLPCQKIELGYKELMMQNTVAYYNTDILTSVNSFMILTLQ